MLAAVCGGAYPEVDGLLARGLHVAFRRGGGLTQRQEGEGQQEVGEVWTDMAVMASTRAGGVAAGYATDHEEAGFSRCGGGAVEQCCASSEDCCEHGL